LAVNITFSSTNNGSAIAGTLDHGNSSNGSSTTAEEIFIRHNGESSITGVALYIREFSGTYSGSATASGDFAEILGWGDTSTVTGFGGVQLNLLSTTSYPVSGWPVNTDKDPTGGKTCRTGFGVSDATAITLPTTTNASPAGVIAKSQTNVALQTRIQVPTNEDTVGIRQFDLVAKYTYTT